MRWNSICVLLCAAMIFCGCKKTTPAGSGNTIKIGQYASTSGNEADFGKSSSAGLMLAVEEANKSGGVLGKQIEVITVDDESKTDQAISAVKRLISSDNVVAIIGEVASTRSIAAAGVCQEKKIPMLSPASTNPAVTKVGDHIFRICFTDDFQGPTNARFAVKKGWKKVAILRDDASDYSKGLAKSFDEMFGKTGQIVSRESYTTTDKDFKSQLQKIKAAGADAVFMPGYYGQVGLVLTQAREMGLTIPFFGGDGWDSPETLKLGKIANGCYFTNHYHYEDKRPEAQAFLKAFQAKYNKTPDGMAVLGYDAGKVMIDAIKRAGKVEPAAIRDALAATKDYPGASGKISIDAQRNARKQIVVLELRDGNTHLAETIEPE